MDIVSTFKERQSKKFTVKSDGYDDPTKHSEAFGKLKGILAPVYQAVEQLHNSGVTQVTPWRAPDKNGCFTAFKLKTEPKIVYRFWVHDKIQVKTTAYLDGTIKLTAKRKKDKYKGRFNVHNERQRTRLVELILDMIVYGRLPNSAISS